MFDNQSVPSGAVDRGCARKSNRSNLLASISRHNSGPSIALHNLFARRQFIYSEDEWPV